MSISRAIFWRATRADSVPAGRTGELGIPAMAGRWAVFMDWGRCLRPTAEKAASDKVPLVDWAVRVLGIDVMGGDLGGEEL